MNAVVRKSGKRKPRAGNKKTAGRKKAATGGKTDTRGAGKPDKPAAAATGGARPASLPVDPPPVTFPDAAAAADDPKSLSWMAQQAVSALEAVKAHQAEKGKVIMARAEKDKPAGKPAKVTGTQPAGEPQPAVEQPSGKPAPIEDTVRPPPVIAKRRYPTRRQALAAVAIAIPLWLYFVSSDEVETVATQVEQEQIGKPVSEPASQSVPAPVDTPVWQPAVAATQFPEPAPAREPVPAQPVSPPGYRTPGYGYYPPQRSWQQPWYRPGYPAPPPR